MNRQSRIAVITGIVCAVLSVCACSRPSRQKNWTVPVERGDITVELRVTGTVTPRTRIPIRPPVPGRLDEVLVQEGQRVRRGQTLARLSSSERVTLLDTIPPEDRAARERWDAVYKPIAIVSPIDGFVIARNAEPGQSLAAADAVLIIADELIVQADVDETDLRHLSQGLAVRLFLDAYPDDRLEGTIEHIAYDARLVNNVTMYAVKIKLRNAPATMRAGMTATVRAVAQRRRNVLTLPLDTITELRGEKYVTVRGSNGTEERRQVVTGISDGRRTEILQGLREGETVVGSGTGSVAHTPRFATMPGLGGGARR